MDGIKLRKDIRTDSTGKYGIYQPELCVGMLVAGKERSSG